MIEKFSDYEGTQFIDQEGEFEFEVMSAEVKDSAAGNPMVVFNCKSDAGSTNLYFSLTPKARWKYNNFIKACLKLDHISKYKDMTLDYETYHNQLIGKHFIGVVEADTYYKTVKVPNDDGTFSEDEEQRVSYKINDFKWVD